MTATDHASAPERIPRIPLALGIAGLAPFVAAALLPWMGNSIWPMATTIYAACILSFMGGVQWGALLAAPPAAKTGVGYVLSVVPALVAWAALLAAAAPAFTLGLLVAGFAAVWAVDVWMRMNGLTPAWYLRLRHVLTAGVLLCMVSLSVRLLDLPG